jgi:hypothetical protein
MPFKGFRPDPVRGTNNGNPVPGHVDPSRTGLFPSIFGDVLGGIVPDVPFPTPVYSHGQGSPAPDTGPIRPDIAGGIGGQGAPGVQDNGSSLYDILAQLAMGGSNSDPAAMARQAMDLASQEYDPQIAELKRQIGITQGNATNSRDQIGKMYGALAASDKADIPIIDQMFADNRNTVQDDYSQLKNQVAGQYADTQKQQMDLMKQLNIQAAAPDALKNQKADQAFFQGQQGQSQQDTLDAMKLLQTGADNFSTQGSEIAGLEGFNRQADVMQQLQDYMTQAQGRIGDLTNQEQSAYRTNLSQLGQQQQQGTQNQFSNLLQLAKMQQDQQQFDAGLQAKTQQNQPQYRSGPLAASQYLGEADPENATNINSVLLQVLQGQPFTTGQIPNPVDPSRSTALTPEAAAQLAVQQAAAQGMSPQSQQELYMAMLAYYGRLSG